jgi:hypothetical protein
MNGTGLFKTRSAVAASREGRRRTTGAPPEVLAAGVPDGVWRHMPCRRGPGQVRGQSARGPPTNPYRDDGGQALIQINAAPMFGQRLN